MTTFLTFLGIITLFVFAKFIYDTYISSNTKENWKQYQQANPEGAARIERSKGLDFNTKSSSNEQDKKNSLIKIANTYGCRTSEAKYIYFDELRNISLTENMDKETIKMCRENKYNQSISLNIDPDDTPAAIMEGWTIEYFKNKEYSYRKRTRTDVMKDIMAIYPEYAKIIMLMNKEIENKYLDENPFMLEVIMSELAYADEPAEKYRLKAINKMSKIDNYSEAIYLLNKGLEFDEPQTEPLIYKLKSEIAIKLSNYDEALFDMDKAIELLLKNHSTNYYDLYEFYKYRSEIKEKLSDIIGVNQDRKKADEYFKMYEANEIVGEDDGLPF